MSKKILVLNPDELLFNFYLLKKQLWMNVCKQHHLEFNEAFFMGYYDAHLEKQEKIGREYRQFEPYFNEINQQFKDWLASTLPKMDDGGHATILQLESKFTIYFVTNLPLASMQTLLKAYQLDQFELFSTKHVLNGKPEPDIYLKIARQKQIKTNEMFIVDSTLNGIQASYLAHAKGIFLNLYGEPISTMKKFSTIRLNSLEDLQVFLNA